MSKETRYIDTFVKFNLSESQNSLPTKEMIDWYQKNTQYMDDWDDELEIDIEMDKIRQNFFDKFEDELKEVNMFDVWIKLF